MSFEFSFGTLIEDCAPDMTGDFLPNESTNATPTWYVLWDFNDLSPIPTLLYITVSIPVGGADWRNSIRGSSRSKLSCIG